MIVMAAIINGSICDGSKGERGDETEKWRRIRKEITCPFCFELFTDPKTIPCLHTFCKQCIDNLQTTNSLENSACCPECQTTISCEISSLPTNFMFSRIAEIFKKKEMGKLDCDNCNEEGTPVVSWCVECNDLLCAKCNDAHSRLKNFKSHKTVTILEFMQDPKKFLSTEKPEACEHHSKELLDLYCKTCRTLICRDCTLKDHPDKMHEFEFASKVVNEEKRRLKDVTASLKGLLKQVRNGVKRREECEKQVETASEANIRKIKDVYAEIHKLLKQQEQETLRKVNTIQESLKMILAVQKGSMKPLEAQLVSCQEFSDNVVTVNGTQRLLRYNDWIIDRVDYLTKQVEHASIDPRCIADNLTLTCPKPAEFVASLNMVTATVPFCTVCSIVVKPNEIKLVAMLKDVCGSPIVDQSKNLQICCNKEREFVKNVKIEEQPDGLYHIWYSLKRTENHLISIYCAGLVVRQEEIKVLANLRDYASINQEVMIINKYGTKDKPLKLPYLFAKGLNDEIMVNDDETNQLVIFDHQLKFSHVIGGSGNEKLQGITGVTMDRKGHVYIADYKLDCIKKFKLDGRFIGQFGSKGVDKGQFRSPFGLLVSTAELLFVCDRYNNRIQVFHSEQFSYSFGKYGREPGELHEPVDLTMNANEDQLFITDNRNHRVQVFAPNGQFLQIFGIFPGTLVELKNPVGICFTPDGHILICSNGTDSILVFEVDGQYVSTIKGTYQGKERFSSPCGIMVRNNGQIVVASNEGNCGNRLVLF